MPTRTSHPSGSRHLSPWLNTLGFCPWFACCEPQKIIGTIPCPISSRFAGFMVVSQPLNGSRYRRSQINKTMIAGYLYGDAAANQGQRLLANPSMGFTASPKLTIETDAGSGKAPDPASHNKKPGPICCLKPLPRGPDCF